MPLELGGLRTWTTVRDKLLTFTRDRLDLEQPPGRPRQQGCQSPLAPACPSS